MPSEVRLTTDRIRLRSMEDRDKEHLLRLFTDKEVMKYYPGVKNERETQDWIDWNKRNEKGYRVSLWIAEDKRTGEFLGQCGIVPQKIGHEVYMEIGYMFARRHWGKGYATETARGCLDYGFNACQYGKMIALIDPENTSSIRVAERIGMAYNRTIEKRGKSLCVYERKPSD
ncbi:GNAT family N-acetyltransferase [Bacillus atrophaeus]|uniref:GNAT family N-acetyltransferase n=1 Tax=Bacillus atrophaeus TaxID=1452 RepID=UPI00123BB710|nr:GNAT family N-acetyltransferase [Bacillus atrophaeus]KAA6453868.1 N-acetyltransferase [Bacillus atrophaeus]